MYVQSLVRLTLSSLLHMRHRRMEGLLALNKSNRSTVMDTRHLLNRLPIQIRIPIHLVEGLPKEGEVREPQEAVVSRLSVAAVV